LISVDDGYHLWSDRYDRNLDDVFAVEDEIARAVAVALRARIGAPAATQAPTHDLVAYEAYIKARQAEDVWTRSSFDRAYTFYQQAIARDPNFAAAHAGLAELYSLMDHRAGLTSLPVSETYRLSIEEAQKALAIDPDSSEAHSALGHIDVHAGRFAEADEHLTRSILLNPNNAVSHMWLGVLRVAQRRFPEAKVECQTGLRLDPLNVRVAAVASANFAIMGEYQLSADAARLGLRTDPNYAGLYESLARAEMFSGHFPEAERALDQAAQATEPDPSQRENRALLLAVQGKTGEALAVLAAVERDGHGQAEHMIRAYAAAGHVDDALRWAARLAHERPNYARVSLDLPPLAAFASTRNDPRYLAIRHGLGLSD
jgi:tetratricopeptide (TPR) repeat protein